MSNIMSSPWRKTPGPALLAPPSKRGYISTIILTAGGRGMKIKRRRRRRRRRRKGREGGRGATVW
jgi:hypothetical protein